MGASMHRMFSGLAEPTFWIDGAIHRDRCALMSLEINQKIVSEAETLIAAGRKQGEGH